MDPASSPIGPSRSRALPAHASHQRGEWQQRIHALLYHHGIPQRRDLLTLEKREWLAALRLPAIAREQIEISLQIIDALDVQRAPLDKELRSMPVASRAARR